MIDIDRAGSFDAVAAAYDTGRPGYPEPLIDECVRLAGLSPSARVLEIGCGTGQATRSFARRGFHMTCLEPGANLAGLARANLAAHANLVVLQQRFEDWPLEPGAFDLVLAATSLHHVAADIRYAKSAAALKPGGHLALLQNHPGQDDSTFRAELDRIYARWWGEQSTKDYHELTLERRMAATREEIDGSGFFGPILIRQHAWIVEYDVQRYLSYLDSDSGRLRHPQHVQDGLKADVAAAIAGLGGTVRRGFVAVLALAQLSSDRNAP